jgi:hypothetical protein
MCFQVHFSTKSKIEREMESSAKTRLPLHSNDIIYPSSSLRITPIWYNLSLIFCLPKGEKIIMGLSKSPFLAINAKGGENIKPKAKGPHHHHFKNFEIEDLIGIHKKLGFQLVFCNSNFLNWDVYFQLVYLKIDFQN